jgi:DNA (cytosine-5)-methyltransferase 1
MSKPSIKFVDLFAGMGGLRLGFEQAFKAQGYSTECLLSSEIKPHACEALRQNFGNEYNIGDITKLDEVFIPIPDFDFLLAGFPCQPFSTGGKRQGFLDTRGTLFFEIEKILRNKKPQGFILENVEGLVKHDLASPGDKIGNTLNTILRVLEDDLGYKVKWKVLDSCDFGLPQSRKRIYIAGVRKGNFNLRDFTPKRVNLGSILETGLPPLECDFTERLLARFPLKELLGKSIKDKRGGKNNIHSWEIGIKGEVSKEQDDLLKQIFKERRRKQWAEEIGIDWMDGMPLTLKQIKTFSTSPELENQLKDLVKKGYLKLEHPKKLVTEKVGNAVKKYRAYDESKELGYNIVTGKLSFEVNKILSPDEITPTLVATDMARLVVPDSGRLRKLSTREGLRLFGYPESYSLDLPEGQVFDLLGNTVAVPVVEFVASQLAKSLTKNKHQCVSTTRLIPV